MWETPVALTTRCIFLVKFSVISTHIPVFELRTMAHLFKTGSFYQLLFIVIMVTHIALARPGEFQEYGKQFREDRCKNNDQSVIEVCQRCAKQTKSPIVYPMCCENEEDAFNWCDKYINYGKKSK